MDIITWLVVGLIAGVLATAVMGSWGVGIGGDIALGIVGAFVGGGTFRALGWHAPFDGLAGVVSVAFIGAILVLGALRIVRAGTAPRS
jgi:uncharacterized membrane protein YeaQ/YmgE (transglycosylase-associated protein family)